LRDTSRRWRRSRFSSEATSPKPREAEAEGEQKIEVQKETGPLTLGKVQSMFPENLLSKLYFEDAGDSIIIRPRSYLGDEFHATGWEAYTSAPEKTVTSKSQRSKTRFKPAFFLSLKGVGAPHFW